MRPVAGLRRTRGVLEPCAEHGAEACVVSCPVCVAWWKYEEAVKSAGYWREQYRIERSKRIALERKVS